MNDEQFFLEQMQIGLQTQDDACIFRAISAEGMDNKRQYQEMAACYRVDLSAFTMPILGTAAMDAMGIALLSMSVLGWERFYRGYVDWTRSRSKNVMAGKEEENARGDAFSAEISARNP